ncbi:dihydropteroate synthase [Vulcanisaeta sp. JCM 14467]|uniref:dihydropteroate synthase n=1 Tax=Vulcanisaeta sp. JCM 14467 TaxID=1295370 RepID=UPI0006CF4B2D|nr:dihydropteroate synthase [Vulcanisaeta sp. JCM 14467]
MPRALLGRVWVGDGEPVRIVGVINVSPESFFKGSVRRSVDEVVKAAESMIANGVDVIDIGGMSTAPYNKTVISADEEINRVVPVIKALKSEFPELTISIDTFRAGVAEAALEAGADVVNDVTGLKGDRDIVRVIADHGASVIIMARERAPSQGDPISRTVNALRESIEAALGSGVKDDGIVIDPGVGAWPPLSIDPILTGGEPLRGDYIRGDKTYPWYSWDSIIITGIGRIRSELNRPVLVGISRKSFLERLMRRRAPPEERLFASVAAEAIAVLMGADAVRTHNIGESRDAVRVAEALRQCLGKDPSKCNEELIRLVNAGNR